jgi:hypothetical protein
MANMEYRRQQQGQGITSDPGWVLLCAIIAVVFCLAALPWIVLGWAVQRLLRHWLPWRLSLLLWLVLSIVGVLLLYHSYQQRLIPPLEQEIMAYVVAVKHYQSDLAAYPLWQLWAKTWPVWLQSWQGIGIAGFAAELWSANASTDTARTLRQHERERERRALRFQRRARRQTNRPAHIPDAVSRNMVIGVPIHDDEEA